MDPTTTVNATPKVRGILVTCACCFRSYEVDVQPHVARTEKFFCDDCCKRLREADERSDNCQAGGMPQPPASLAEAMAMLIVFEGIGVRSFALTLTDETGRKVSFSLFSAGVFHSALPSLLDHAIDNRLNLIVRPSTPPGLSLIQLDDLSESQVDRLLPFAFLTLETSPGNFQAWLAVKDGASDTARRVKKATGADPTASGASRIAGSQNFKAKYAPTFPFIRLAQVSPGLTLTLPARASRAARAKGNH